MEKDPREILQWLSSKPISLDALTSPGTPQELDVKNAWEAYVESDEAGLGVWTSNFSLSLYGYGGQY